MPKVVVFLRKLSADGELGAIIRRETALTHLGLLRLGSVWQDNVRKSITPYEQLDLKVSFDPSRWRYFSPRSEIGRHREPFSADDYCLSYRPDANYLLEFDLAHARRLLIPCTEFFVRCYGRSEEVKRVLATYPWQDAQRRLYRQDTEGTGVVLPRRLHRGDAVFLWHARHDPFAQRAAKSIYSQLEQGFAAQYRYVFLKAGPWFTGDTRIRVEGLRVDDGRSFLALRIVGMGEPEGKPIAYGWELTGAGEEAESGEEARGGFRPRTVMHPPVEIELTHDAEPDHGAGTLPVEEEDFVILGEPRRLIRRKRSGRGGSGKSPVADDSVKWSTGESYGGGSGTGHASVHARSVLESKGLLRDMWIACRSLADNSPDLVRSVEWFTFEDGYSSAEPPRLVAFEPVPADEKVEGAVRSWPYLDMAGGALRGALIIRLRFTDGTDACMFEIQRKERRESGKAAEKRAAGDSYKGMVFTVDSPDEFVAWIRHLLAQAPRRKGVLGSLARQCPGIAHTFKHSSSGSDRIPCEAAVGNALRKIFGRRIG